MAPPSSLFIRIVLLVIAAPAFTAAFTRQVAILHVVTPTQLGVADYSSTASAYVDPRTDAPHSQSMPSISSATGNHDEVSKAILTQAISATQREDVLPKIFSSTGSVSMWMDNIHEARHPSTLPGWIVKDHHPADFETDGGIMMTEHLEPHPIHLATVKDRMRLAVSERVARAMERQGQKPPAAYYFD
jgi:hypothetical protein